MCGRRHRASHVRARGWHLSHSDRTFSFCVSCLLKTLFTSSITTCAITELKGGVNRGPPVESQTCSNESCTCTRVGNIHNGARVYTVFPPPPLPTYLSRSFVDPGRRGCKEVSSQSDTTRKHMTDPHAHSTLVFFRVCYDILCFVSSGRCRTSG